MSLLGVVALQSITSTHMKSEENNDLKKESLFVALITCEGDHPREAVNSLKTFASFWYRISGTAVAC